MSRGRTANAHVANRREAKRGEQVTQGLRDLDEWLTDLLRRGLAEAQKQSADFWESRAARLVDDRCPGVARYLRQIAEMNPSQREWTEAVLHRVGRMKLVIEAWHNRDRLTPDLLIQLRTLIGWYQKEAELLSQPGVPGRWLVLGYAEEEENHILGQRVWLREVDSHQWALWLKFTPVRAPVTPDPLPRPGDWLKAEMVYYAGSYPQRAILKNPAYILVPDQEIPVAEPGAASLEEVQERLAEALRKNPWQERICEVIEGLRPVQTNRGWVMVDQRGRAIPLSPAFTGHAGQNGEDLWKMLALSGGHPITACGEWDGLNLLPLAVIEEGRLYSFRRPPKILRASDLAQANLEKP